MKLLLLYEHSECQCNVTILSVVHCTQTSYWVKMCGPQHSEYIQLFEIGVVTMLREVLTIIINSLYWRPSTITNVLCSNACYG